MKWLVCQILLRHNFWVKCEYIFSRKIWNFSVKTISSLTLSCTRILWHVRQFNLVLAQFLVFAPITCWLWSVLGSAIFKKFDCTNTRIKKKMKSFYDTTSKIQFMVILITVQILITLADLIFMHDSARDCLNKRRAYRSFEWKKNKHSDNIYDVIFYKAFKRDNSAKKSEGVKRHVNKLHATTTFFCATESPKRQESEDVSIVRLSCTIIYQMYHTFFLSFLQCVLNIGLPRDSL